MPYKQTLRRILSLLIILVLSLSLVACSSGNSVTSDPSVTAAVTPTETPITEIPQPTVQQATTTPSPSKNPSVGSGENTDSTDFDELADDFFTDFVTSDTISLHFSLAHPEDYGISMDKVTLGELSADSIELGCKEMNDYLNKFKSLDYSKLTEEQQLSYDCAVTFIEAYLKMSSFTYFTEVLGPTNGFQAQLPILLAEYTFYSQNDVDTYLELLDCVDDYFEQVCAYERDKSEKGYFMPDETAQEIIDQCMAFIETPDNNVLIEVFPDNISKVAGLDKEQIEDYTTRNKNIVQGSVIPAYRMLIDTLTELKGTADNQGGLCGLQKGKEYYEALCQYETGSSKTIPEMKKVLNEALKSNMTSLYSIQLKTPSIINDFSNISFPETDPGKVIEHLKTAITDDFPFLDEVDYTINYVPDSLKENLSPAMYLMPPIDDTNNNRIYINDNENTDMSKIYPTLAHEGYPGHLYQAQYFNSTNPPLIRNTIQALGYEEGWTNYCELYSYELSGTNSTLAEYMRANTIAVYCIYSLVDIGVHYDNWTLDDVVNYWAPYGYTKEMATEIYYDILGDPGAYLPYSIGYLELTALRDRMNEAMGDRFEILDFHTFYLDTGVARFSVLNDRLDKYIENN